MREVMFDMTHFCTDHFAGKGPSELFFHRRTLLLALQAINNQRQTWTVQSAVPKFAPEIRSSVLVDGDDVEIGKGGACFRQTVPDGFSWKSRPMFHAAESLFLGCGEKLSVLYQTGSCIPMVSIDAENDHRTNESLGQVLKSTLIIGE